MYYYGGYQGYGSGCGCGGYPAGGGYGYGAGYGAAIILVLFILLVIIIGARAWGNYLVSNYENSTLVEFFSDLLKKIIYVKIVVLEGGYLCLKS